jgi:hypothetical protein
MLITGFGAVAISLFVILSYLTRTVLSVRMATATFIIVTLLLILGYLLGFIIISFVMISILERCLRPNKKNTK